MPCLASVRVSCRPATSTGLARLLSKIARLFFAHRRCPRLLPMGTTLLAATTGSAESCPTPTSHDQRRDADPPASCSDRTRSPAHCHTISLPHHRAAAGGCVGPTGSSTGSARASSRRSPARVVSRSGVASAPIRAWRTRGRRRTVPVRAPPRSRATRTESRPERTDRRRSSS